MKITIESTDQITTIDGVSCRVWNGTTERGVPCKVFVYLALIASAGADIEQFEREVKELPPGRAVVRDVL